MTIVADHDPTTGRTHPRVDFPEIDAVTEIFLQGILADEGLYRAGLDLVVMQGAPEDLPEMPRGLTTIFPVWNGQHRPNSIIPALVAIVERTGAQDIVCSGGRTDSTWPVGENEAEKLQRRISAQTTLDLQFYLEKQALNTRDTARFVCELFPKLIAESQTLIFLAHLIHTRRVMMSKRQAFCHDFNLMTEAEFDARVHMVAYDAGVPALDPHDPLKLAETLARLKIYSKAEHIRATPVEAEMIENIYTRAERYALSAGHDRVRDPREYSYPRRVFGG